MKDILNEEIVTKLKHASVMDEMQSQAERIVDNDIVYRQAYERGYTKGATDARDIVMRKVVDFCTAKGMSRLVKQFEDYYCKIKEASDECCGNCVKFDFEDIDGWGICTDLGSKDYLKHCSYVCSNHKTK